MSMPGNKPPAFFNTPAIYQNNNTALEKGI